MKIEIRWRVEQDELEVRGNALASGDDAADRACEDEIIRRLESGDVWAWAWVECVARCEVDGIVFEGSDSLGACSYDSRADFMRDAYAKGMRERAIDDMRESMKHAVKRGDTAGKALCNLRRARMEIEEVES